MLPRRCMSWHRPCTRRKTPRGSSSSTLTWSYRPTISCSFQSLPNSPRLFSLALHASSAQSTTTCSASIGRRTRGRGFVRRTQNTCINSGILLVDIGKMRASENFTAALEPGAISRLFDHFQIGGTASIGDQDFFLRCCRLNTRNSFFFNFLSCGWYRALCQFWRKVYLCIFDQYVFCDNRSIVYHGNCDSVIPPWISPLPVWFPNLIFCLSGKSDGLWALSINAVLARKEIRFFLVLAHIPHVAFWKMLLTLFLVFNFQVDGGGR
jgi:hypothetical protein